MDLVRKNVIKHYWRQMRIGANVMKVLAKVLLIVVLSLGANLAMAAPDPAFDAATAAVTCTVDEIIEWDDTVNAGNFLTIAIANISAQADTPEASRSLVLYTNCDLDITADRTTEPNNAQLKKTTDSLVTEYKLEYDGDGDPDTGGTNVGWTDWTTFLGAGGSAVTHVTLDGAVAVTLFARASNADGTLADAGNYHAHQTLTASWGAP